jgi:hypothetical protein
MFVGQNEKAAAKLLAMTSVSVLVIIYFMDICHTLCAMKEWLATPSKQ